MAVESAQLLFLFFCAITRFAKTLFVTRHNNKGKQRKIGFFILNETFALAQITVRFEMSISYIKIEHYYDDDWSIVQFVFFLRMLSWDKE